MPAPDRHFKEEIHDLLDGRLNAAARLEVERHLETCEECRRAFDAMRWTKKFAALHFAARSPFGGKASCPTIQVAAAAVATGLADHVLVYRAFNERSGRRFALVRNRQGV